MANNYLQFSEALKVTPEEEEWIKHQLEDVTVPETEVNPEGDPEGELEAIRFLLEAIQEAKQDVRYADWIDKDWLEYPGFQWHLEDDRDMGRILWVHADESGNAGHAAYFVHKLLKHFDKDECWALTYATTCSRPRIGEFGGGAVFVTKAEIDGTSAHAWAEQKRVQWRAARSESV